VQTSSHRSRSARASESYRLSDLRLKQGAPGARWSEVVQSAARLEAGPFQLYMLLVRYNKAQVRCLLLAGTGGVRQVSPGEPERKRPE